MTRSHDLDPGFDARVADWLDADPDDAPAAALDTVLVAFPSVSQGGATRLKGRLPTMYRFAYFAAAATATLAVIAVAGGGLLKTSPPAVVASASPSTSVPRSPTPSAFTITRLGHNGLIAAVHEGALVLVDPASGKTTKVLVPRPNDDTNPYAVSDVTWAPDGRRLAYVSHDGPIFVIDTSTGVSERILDCGIEADGCSIAWSPDGGRIALMVRGQLQLIDPDGGNRQVLHQFAGYVTQPTWSPDGLRIAGVEGDTSVPDRGRGLFAIDRDGSNLTPLIGPFQGIGTFDPAWSPDGNSIAYLGSTEHETCPRPSAQGTCQDDWQLHAMLLELGGSAPRALDEAGVCDCLGFMPGLTWSPDGTRLALVIPSDGSRDWGLEILNVQGGGKTPVTDGWGPVAWQPVP